MTQPVERDGAADPTDVSLEAASNGRCECVEPSPAPARFQAAHFQPGSRRLGWRPLAGRFATAFASAAVGWSLWSGAATQAEAPAVGARPAPAAPPSDERSERIDMARRPLRKLLELPAPRPDAGAESLADAENRNEARRGEKQADGKPADAERNVSPQPAPPSRLGDSPPGPVQPPEKTPDGAPGKGSAKTPDTKTPGKSPGKSAAKSAERAGEDDRRGPLDDLRHWLERNAAQRTVHDRQRDHASIREAFKDVVATSRRSTLRVLSDELPVALGTVVDADGYVVSKASELRGKLACVTSEGKVLTARLVAVRTEFDLALLKVEADEPLTPVEWSREQPVVGSLIATPGQDVLPAAIGVVSVVPRRIPAAIGFLGVGLDLARPRVVHVQPGSGAHQAGLLVDDLVVSVNGQKIENRESLQTQIRKHEPGQRVELGVRRGDHEFKVVAVLGDAQTGLLPDRGDFQNRLGGSLSGRRAGFESVLQHDTVLHPNECGGPLVDLDGRAIGINIARAGRVASYAIPAEVALPLVERLLGEQREAAAEAAAVSGRDDLTTTKAGG